MSIRSLLFVCLSVYLTSCIDPYPRIGGRSAGGGKGDAIDTSRQAAPKEPVRLVESSIRVTNIRLTSTYTILYLTYTERETPELNVIRDIIRKLAPNRSIGFDSRAQLVAATGTRVFRFLKADDIPIEPKKQKTYSGRRYSFAVYFEPLDKGIENFDLVECNNADCWNITNLHVRNPAESAVMSSVQAPANPSEQPGVLPIPVAVTLKSADPPVVGMIVVSGIVSNSLTRKPVTATIDYLLSNTATPVDSVQSFIYDGLYRMPLKPGQVYTYVASAKGYLPSSGVLDLSKLTTNNQKITRDIALKPLLKGTKITLQNIYFAMSESELLPASFAELDRLVTVMQDNPRMRIRLEGHTDIVGGRSGNLQLSRDRVLACQRYLVKKRIDVDRIETMGYGDTRPITTKGTDEDRKVNRRVEFAVLSL